MCTLLRVVASVLVVSFRAAAFECVGERGAVCDGPGAEPRFWRLLWGKEASAPPGPDCRRSVDYFGVAQATARACARASVTPNFQRAQPSAHAPCPLPRAPCPVWPKGGVLLVAVSMTVLYCVKKKKRAAAIPERQQLLHSGGTTLTYGHSINGTTNSVAWADQLGEYVGPAAPVASA